MSHDHSENKSIVASICLRSSSQGRRSTPNYRILLPIVALFLFLFSFLFSSYIHNRPAAPLRHIPDDFFPPPPPLPSDFRSLSESNFIVVSDAGEQAIMNEKNKDAQGKRINHSMKGTTNVKVCEKNPFLAILSPDSLAKLEEMTRSYNDELLSKIAAAESAATREDFTSMWMALTPLTSEIFHSPHSSPLCPQDWKYYGGQLHEGGIADGGKFICGIKELNRRVEDDGRSCNILSLGSNNDFSFEESILKHSRCSISTFDCTSKPPSIPLHPNPSRHSFHSLCIGDVSTWDQQHINVVDQPPADKFISFKDVYEKYYPGEKKAAGPIDVLKMDIEGAEFDVYQLILHSDAESSSLLPYQIVFESHLDDEKRQVGRQAIMIQQLIRLGYRFLSAEVNQLWKRGIEFVALRVYC